MKPRVAACTRILSLTSLALASFAGMPAMASTFRLQSTTVIMDESDRRTSFNVENTGGEPILLLSKLSDLDDKDFAKSILVTPAVTRIDPGQSQLVNFALKKGVSLDREYLLKASFEGVTQKAKGGTRMPIRQEIGFIAQPKSMPADATPWKALNVRVEGNQITLANPSKRVVRLGPAIRLQPSGVEIPLAHAYIMPGQSMSATAEGAAAATQITITPLSRYGLVQATATLDVSR
ncbi:fimbria/pilus chaperone family protein [Dyella sp. OK004]|uniref:fimbria/pilus chaperone family protein n=1 Tax=Dyella sp. OK004 TaxID=1855292 RepID=UPI001C433B1F|nr:fimbria/pilus chaperone family protein [Dyella sp. OK004]